jgi:hypothetical protein
MIADAILKLFLDLFTAILDALPTWSNPVPPQIGSLVNAMSAYDSIAPFHELMEVSGATLLLVTAVYALKIGFKIFGSVRGSGG